MKNMPRLKFTTDSLIADYQTASIWCSSSHNVCAILKTVLQVGIMAPYIFKANEIAKDIVTTKEYEEALKNAQKKNWNQTVVPKRTRKTQIK